MNKNTSVVSIMAIAALLSIGAIAHAQPADASTFSHPMMLANASMDMKGMDMKNMKMEAPATITHHGAGIVKKIDANSGIVKLAHGPIASLNWPAMTMGFKLKDAALAKGIKSGDVVNFDLIQSGDEYVITRLEPSGK
jgi:Cu(I)/Ag(I) efflux system membrane fusion protein/cobalt-zinc-cadmium efflux system membrane fusion protein